MPRMEDHRRQVVRAQKLFRTAAENAYPERHELGELRRAITDACYPDIFAQLRKLPFELQHELALPLFYDQFPNGFDFGSELLRLINFPWLKPSRELSRTELEALGREAQLNLGLEPRTSIVFKDSTKHIWDLSDEWKSSLSAQLNRNREVAENSGRGLACSMSEEMADSLGTRSDRPIDNTILKVHLSHRLLRDVTQLPTSPVDPMVKMFELGANPIGLINGAFYITVPTVPRMVPVT